MQTGTIVRTGGAVGELDAHFRYRAAYPIPPACFGATRGCLLARTFSRIHRALVAGPRYIVFRTIF